MSFWHIGKAGKILSSRCTEIEMGAVLAYFVSIFCFAINSMQELADNFEMHLVRS